MNRIIRFASHGVLACLLISTSAMAQNAAPKADPWWKHAVFYELYPRSFQDTNGDGTGDLKGITKRLDYLEKLGVDAIWLTPVYPSPQVDFGYDVSDFEAIDPQYGTLADFDELVAKAKQHHIRVLMDIVLNHTSDQHAWFKEARSSKDSPKRDWFVWHDGKANGAPPNNWQSGFGHSSWQLDPATNQFYYHMYYPQQPDLNWRNPAVRKAMYAMLRFWLDRGVAGFRLDSVPTLFEDAEFRDAKVLPGKTPYGDPNQEQVLMTNLPEVHDVLREIHQVMASYPGDRVIVGEAYLDNVADLRKMYGEHDDEVQLPMDMQFALINKLDVAQFHKFMDEAQTQLGGHQPLFVFDNHDQPRSIDRYGDGAHNDAISRMLTTILLTTRATPLLYNGEELGMVTTPPARVEDVKDPIGKLGWPKEKGRDGERTPMQWDATRNAGFTTGTPWLPVPPGAASVNAAAEVGDPASIFAWTQKLIQLRRTQRALREGDFHWIAAAGANVLAWTRSADGETVAVMCNFSGTATSVTLEAPVKSVLAKNGEGTEAKTGAKGVSLSGFGTLVLRTGK